MSGLWPLRGLLLLLGRPSLALRPLGAVLFATVGVMVTGLLVLGWRWPHSAAGGHWGPWILHGAAAIGESLTTVLLLWILITPWVMSLALERLARRVQGMSGDEVAGPESVAGSRPAGALSGLAVLLRTLPMRLGWMAVALVSLWLGPLGSVVGAYAFAYIASHDALDTALGARGLSAARRLQLLRDHRRQLLGGSLSAALLNLALGATVIGWLIWLPALVAGAAREVMEWPALAEHDPASRLSRAAARPLRPD